MLKQTKDTASSWNSKRQNSTTLQFINIINPADTTDSKRKSTIRSHAAKQGCLRKRQGSLEIRLYQPITSSAPSDFTNSNKRCNTGLHSEDGKSRLQKDCWKSNWALSGDLKAQIWPLKSRHRLSHGRKNPFESYPRRLNTVEHFLIDHCELL
jgi:hypothetical protein